ncbi:LysR family transcriptional regulator [Vibrio gazogenes]|uniref:LysR family transcriptional regulator n=1 Tax=Vibrio gazogenes TaxID=687 RepID=A0A1Z2SEW2_VIBGA|nr:LysR family transcriptional regulator [Vibrio gazogenes]ASA55723.1 LysR family transcriptional regulator [Vibrio gazogenes]
MTFTQLEIFSVLSDSLHFTIAAQRLGISQSGVSHAIKALEDEFGVKLFHRHQSRVELTDIGTRLLARSRTVLGVAETMRQEATDAQGMKQGMLRIGSFGPTSSVRLLPHMIHQYQKKFPGIEVYIDEGPDMQVVQWLRERRVDVCFVVLPENDLDVFPLLDDQMVALLPVAHPLSRLESVTLSSLCYDPFILTGAGSGEWVIRLFHAEKLQPQIRYRTSQLLSILSLVESGDAISVVAESSLPDRDSDRYVCRPLSPPIKRRIGLAVLDSHQASPAVKAFITLAQQLHSVGA